jgi:hypothetical protein
MVEEEQAEEEVYVTLGKETAALTCQIIMFRTTEI